MGRPQFEQIVTQAPREKLFTSELYPNGIVYGGTSEDIYYYSEPNTITRLHAVYVLARTMGNATVGTHSIKLGYTSPIIDMLEAVSDFSSDILLHNGIIVKGNSSMLPQDQSAQYQALTNVTYDDQTPFRVTYRNDLDVTQTKGREIRIIGVKRQVG